MDADQKAYLNAMRKDLAQQSAGARQEARQLAKTNERLDITHQRIDTVNATTRTELGTLIEAMNAATRVVLAEAVAISNERMGALLTNHERRITRLEERRA